MFEVSRMRVQFPQIGRIRELAPRKVFAIQRVAAGARSAADVFFGVPRFTLAPNEILSRWRRTVNDWPNSFLS